MGGVGGGIIAAFTAGPHRSEGEAPSKLCSSLGLVAWSCSVRASMKHVEAITTRNQGQGSGEFFANFGGTRRFSLWSGGGRDVITTWRTFGCDELAIDWPMIGRAEFYIWIRIGPGANHGRDQSTASEGSRAIQAIGRGEPVVLDQSAGLRGRGMGPRGRMAKFARFRQDKKMERCTTPAMP